MEKERRKKCMFELLDKLPILVFFVHLAAILFVYAELEWKKKDVRNACLNYLINYP